MSTESAGSFVDASAVSIQQKNPKRERRVPLEKGAPAKLDQRWDWHDVLYLLILVGLVVAMAIRYTPNFTGEVAGEWWDPLLNIWTMSWDTTTLLHAPTHLWQAQLLYPNNLSLTFSENLLGETLLYAPFYLATHNPVLAYNITFYLTFVLCGINMYIMARHYIGKPFASFVAALIYAFAPYRIGQIDHIHIVAGEWMPLAFLYIDLALERGRWRHWILFALFYLLQLLSSVYYGIFLSYALLTFVLFRYAKPFVTQLRSTDKRSYLKYLFFRGVRPALVFAIMFVFLGILMAPYLASLHSGFSRSLDQTAGYSAFVRDFGFADPFNWLYGISYYNGVLLPYDSEHYLFLGLTTLALGILGVILVLRFKLIMLRPYMWTGLIVLLFAFGPFLQYSTPSGAPFVAAASRFLGLVALPPNPPHIPMPWLLAYFILPGFSGLRVPARLVGVLLIILALMAAQAVAWLQTISSGNATERRDEPPNLFNKHFLHSTTFSFLRGIVIRCLLIAIPLTLLLEAAPAYLPVTMIPTGNAIPAVYQWLAVHGDQQPIVELPMASVDRNFETKQEAWYDYYATYHSHPIANGWSGYRPPLTANMAFTLLNFPSEASLTLLKKYHIYYVVLHLQFYSTTIAHTLVAQMESNPDLRRVAEFGYDSVWQVI